MTTKEDKSQSVNDAVISSSSSINCQTVSNVDVLNIASAYKLLIRILSVFECFYEENFSTHVKKCCFLMLQASVLRHSS